MIGACIMSNMIEDGSQNTIRDLMKDIKDFMKEMRGELMAYTVRLDSIFHMEASTHYFTKELDRRVSNLENEHQKEKNYDNQNLWRSKGFWGIITGATALCIEVWARIRGYK